MNPIRYQPGESFVKVRRFCRRAFPLSQPPAFGEDG